MNGFTQRLEALVEEPASLPQPPEPPAADQVQNIDKRLGFIDESIKSVRQSMTARTPRAKVDDCLLQHLLEKVNLLETKLSSATDDIITLPDEGTLRDSALGLEYELSTLSVDIKRLRLDEAQIPKTDKAPDTGLELAKIGVPAFDGNILAWASFWEQFDISVHSNSRLQDAVKLAYLKEALKDGPAKNITEGLAHTAKNYKAAIKCLRDRFD